MHRVKLELDERESAGIASSMEAPHAYNNEVSGVTSTSIEIRRKGLPSFGYRSQTPYYVLAIWEAQQ
jgi:hypothetical protein